MSALDWRDVDLAGVVLAGLAAGYVMALGGLWAGRVPGLVAIDIADYGRRYMVSDRPSAWVLGLLSHLANSVLLVLARATLVEPNLDWHRVLEGVVWGLVLAVGLAGALVGPLAGIGFMGRRSGGARFALTNLAMHASGGCWSGPSTCPDDRRARPPPHRGPLRPRRGPGLRLDGQLRADQLHGLFAGDTRVLSTYRLTAGGHSWHVLARHRLGHGTARWKFQNDAIREGGVDVAAGRCSSTCADGSTGRCTRTYASPATSRSAPASSSSSTPTSPTSSR